MHWLCPKCRAGFEERRERCPADSARLIQNLSGRVYGGRWRVERLLGIGGGGATVWAAVGLETHRPVALKLAPVQDVAEVRRFERGARISGMLEHPHITRVVEHGRDAENVMLVMEQLEGETLKRKLGRQRAMSPAEAAHVADQILDALEFAHFHGVVHRDIKLSNLFVTPTASDPLFVKILDWGISKFVAGKEPEALHDANEAEDVAVTQAQQILGTPEYMAPEQIIGGAADVRSDIYAMGIVLYMLLTGKHPFEAKTRAEMYHSHLMKEVPPLSNGIGTRLDAVVRQALAKRPEDRWASAGAMRRALNAVMHAPEPNLAPMRGSVTGVETRPSLAFGNSLVGRPPESDVTTTENVQTAGAPLAAPKSRRKVFAIAAIGAVAALATVLVIALPGSAGTASEPPPREAALATQPGVKVAPSEDEHPDLQLGAVPSVQLAPLEGATREPGEPETVASDAGRRPAEATKATPPKPATRELRPETARTDVAAKPEPTRPDAAKIAATDSAPGVTNAPASTPTTVVVAPAPTIVPTLASLSQTGATTPPAPPVAASAPTAPTVAPPTVVMPATVAPSTIVPPTVVPPTVAPTAPAAPDAVAVVPAPKPTGNEILPFTAGMSRPVRIAGSDPRYTNQALAAKVSGTLVVRCIIELDGSLSGCKILKPVTHMEQATLDALAGHRFRPIMFEGRARRVSYVFNFNFVSPKQ